MRAFVWVRGQAAIMLSLSMVVSLGTLGLVTDVGWMYWRKEAAESAAQSAAMAGVMQVSKSLTSSTVTCGSGVIWCSTTAPQACSTSPTNTNSFGTACLYAKQNGFVATGRQNVTIAAGTNTPPTVSGVSTTYYVTARVTEQIPLTFLATLGSGNWGQTAARATAAIVSTGAGSCVYVLDQANTAAALSLSNGVTVTSECGYYVNSSSTSALSVIGGATLKALDSSQIVVHGGAAINNGGSTSPAPPETNQPVTADPFASKPVPWSNSASTRTYECDYTGCNHTTCDYNNYNWTSWVNQLTVSPGVYCGGLNIGNVNSVVFQPGVYIINGGGMNIGGSGGISGGVTGTGVLFFDTGTNANYAGITLGNGVNFTLSAPTSGSLAGILFYQDPGITAPTGSNTTSYFDGGSNLALTGTIYLPNTTLNFSNGTSTASTSTALVVKDLVFTGGAYFKQSSNGSTGLGGSSAVYWIE